MGKRSIENNGKKLNIFKVIVVIILIIAVVIGIYFLIKNLKSDNLNTSSNDNNEEILAEEISEENKTIDEIIADFGGEVIEQVKSDTYYIKKDNVEYTAYLDGEILEGKIIPWDGTSNKPTMDEAGNIDIYKPDELKWIADQVIRGEMNFSGVTITLRKNLDFGARKDEDGSWEGNEWTSIVGFLDNSQNNIETEENSGANDSITTIQENLKRFAGIFDGNNLSIRGIYINSENKYQGLFGYNTGEIINLSIKSSNINGRQGTGAIVGLNEGKIKNCNIENVYINGTEKIGGIVGIGMTGSSIENCHIEDNHCLVKGENYVGGIVGYLNNNTIISNTTNKASVIGKDYIGGIAGIAFYGTTITKCSNQSLNIAGNDYVGGLIGYSQAQIENSYNQENLKGILTGNNYVGGLVGLNYSMGNITDSFNSSSITTFGDNCGGIVGLNSATVSNCYNRGDINSEKSEGLKIGGICGQNSSESYIYTSYNIGNISTQKYAGGLVGANFGNISNSFYLDSTIKNEVEEFQKTDLEMKNDIISNLGESFKEDTENTNLGYPILIWE